MKDIIESMTVLAFVNKENEIYYSYVRSLLMVVNLLSLSNISDNEDLKKCTGMVVCLSALISNQIKERYEIN